MSAMAETEHSKYDDEAERYRTCWTCASIQHYRNATYYNGKGSVICDSVQFLTICLFLWNTEIGLDLELGRTTTAHNRPQSAADHCTDQRLCPPGTCQTDAHFRCCAVCCCEPSSENVYQSLNLFINLFSLFWNWKTLFIRDSNAFLSLPKTNQIIFVQIIDFFGNFVMISPIYPLSILIILPQFFFFESRQESVNNFFSQ